MTATCTLQPENLRYHKYAARINALYYCRCVRVPDCFESRRWTYIRVLATLQVIPIRLYLRARSAIHFPRGKPGNVLRGALGLAFRSIACDPACPDPAACPNGAACVYKRVFAPVPPPGVPSGLADPPRPFVIRARPLSGVVLKPGEEYHFDIHLFDTDPSITAYFIGAFSHIAESGLGPQRGRADLLGVRALDEQSRPLADLYSQGAFTEAIARPVELALEPGPTASRVTVAFLSPTELRKDQHAGEPASFDFLLARIRDRISTLRAFYGPGPLPIDFAAMGQRARQVKLASSTIRSIHTERTSGRTGQTHPIGGFIGAADFEGPLTEFLPYLLAARWTGVGRHAVWGNGEIAVEWS